MIEWLTFGKGCNEHTSKGDDEEPPDDLQTQFIRAFPDMACEALQKFGYGEFGDPDASQLSAMIRSFIIVLVTYNMAYMILDAKTSLLPISRWWISRGVRPSLVVLFVPQSRTT